MDISEYSDEINLISLMSFFNSTYEKYGNHIKGKNKVKLINKTEMLEGFLENCTQKCDIGKKAFYHIEQ